MGLNVGIVYALVISVVNSDEGSGDAVKSMRQPVPASFVNQFHISTVKKFGV